MFEDLLTNSMRCDVSAEAHGLRGLCLQEQELGNQLNAQASRRPNKRTGCLKPRPLCIPLVAVTLSGAHSLLCRLGAPLRGPGSSVFCTAAQIHGQDSEKYLLREQLQVTEA